MEKDVRLTILFLLSSTIILQLIYWYVVTATSGLKNIVRPFQVSVITATTIESESIVKKTCGRNQWASKAL